MLVRLVLLILLGIGVATALGWWRKQRRLVSGESLTPIDRKALTEQADRSEAVKEALDLHTKIQELLERREPGVSGREIRNLIDRVLAQLSSEQQILERVEGALSSFDPNKLAEERSLEEEKLTQGVDPELKASSRRAMDRLDTQEKQIIRLRERRSTLESVQKQIVVELRNVHLALLDALSSRAGLADGQLASMQKSLTELSDGLRHQASADEEIALLMAAEARGKQAEGT